MIEETKKKLLELFDNASSVKTLNKVDREKILNHILTFTEDQMKAIIVIFESESSHLSELNAKIDEYNNDIDSIFSQLKQAGKNLKSLALKECESGSIKSDKEKTGHLLDELNKI